MRETSHHYKTEHYKGYDYHMPVQYYPGMNAYASIYHDSKFIAEAWGKNAKELRKMVHDYIDGRELPQRTGRYLK
jgi:hypothetical protein